MPGSAVPTDSEAAYPPGVPQELTKVLELRAVRSDEDVERLAEFNAFVNQDPAAGALTEWWLSGTHPTVNLPDFLYVENTETGEVVSTVGLITETWTYEGIPLQVGRVELVGTHPDYRRQGLVVAQMNVIERMLEAKNCAMSCIAGIPHFYRQFGYEYAIPLDSCASMRLDQVPALPRGRRGSVSIRGMDPGTDLRQVMDLYEAQVAGLCVTSLRYEALWRFQESAPPGLAEPAGTHVVVDRSGVVGYFRVRKNMWHPWLEFTEACVLPGGQRWGTRDALHAILRFGRDLAEQHDLSKHSFALPERHPLVTSASYLGAQPEQQYAWQVRIADHTDFLKRVSPALERRLAHSLLAGFSGSLDIDLMPRLVRVQLDCGRVSSVADGQRPSRGSILRITPLLLTQLLLGYRSCAEIAESHLEVAVDAPARELVDVLFPKAESFAYSVP